MKRFLGIFIPILLVSFLAFGTIIPLVKPGFFNMHDDTQPSRVFEMAKSLKEGQFPVRMVADLGYGFGYPIYNFYSPLPYYIGAIFHLLGFDAITATKMMFMLAMILSGISMYLLVTEFAPVILAILSSVLYMYAPYHALDLYVRGDAGELYALIFIPIMILGLIKIIKICKLSKIQRGQNFKDGIIIGSTGLAGILLSHNISGFITLFYLGIGLMGLFIWFLVKKYNFKLIFILVFTIIIGIGISAFFTIPAFLEKSYTRVDELTRGGSDFHNHFVYIDQLWDSPWGFGGSAQGRNDGMSFKIGKLHILLGIISILISIYLYKQKKINKFQLSVACLRRQVCYLLSSILISIFLMLEQSVWLWEVIPGFSFIQYPWRFLVFVIFGLSLLPVLTMRVFQKRIYYLISVIIIIVTLLFNIKYFRPQKYENISADNYINDISLKYKISKISDEFLPEDFIIPRSEKDIAANNLSDADGITVSERFESATVKKYKIFSELSGYKTTNIAFFPGWSAQLDGKNIEIGEERGRIKVYIPGGIHQLNLKFGNTPVRNIANAISILSVFLLVYISLFWINFIKCLKKILFRS